MRTIFALATTASFSLAAGFALAQGQPAVILPEGESAQQAIAAGVGLFCQHQDAVTYVLMAVGGGSVLSWFERWKYMPTALKWLARVLNVADWDDVARSLKSATAKKEA